MTPADHAALSAQLARAIGYYPESVRVILGTCIVYRLGVSWHGTTPLNASSSRWQELHYRDPTVWGPVLEWLIKEHWALPAWNRPDRKYMLMLDGKNCYGTTLPEAIARAAIAVAEKRRKRVEQNEAREVLQP